MHSFYDFTLIAFRISSLSFMFRNRNKIGLDVDFKRKCNVHSLRRKKNNFLFALNNNNKNSQS